MKEYNIDSMSFDDFKSLIASGDDSHDNQIIVTKSGKIFLSPQLVTTNPYLKSIMSFTVESFAAGNGYVGKSAANDTEFFLPLYNRIKSNWDNGVPEPWIG